MKTVIALFFYAVVSALFGVVICSLLLWFKKKMAAGIAAVLLFGGPVAVWIAIYIRDSIELDNFQKDVAYVQGLCKKYGGDKIYKTVENVEGVFQMKARNPDSDTQLRDHFGMVDPWGAYQGDWHIEHKFLSDQKAISREGYIFMESQPSYKQEGPPYRRFYLKPTGKKVGDKYPGAHKPDNPELEIVETQVPQLASRYGYYIEDLTTREMREHWVGGGRIKVINLQTREVLAERTGYFRSVGPGNQLAWVGVSGTDHSCPNNSNLYKFLHQVLKPIAYQPIPQYSNFN